MCILFIVISGFLTISFYMNGEFILASVTGIICAILFVFFIRNLINNVPCLFGKRTDCHKTQKE
ncbi:MAG: hypothetical protein IME94_05575 [Proteobacteria bacterium]|nr:hypothetical protein [Pseudomonadota bacterium]